MQFVAKTIFIGDIFLISNIEEYKFWSSSAFYLGGSFFHRKFFFRGIHHGD